MSIFTQIQGLVFQMVEKKKIAGKGQKSKIPQKLFKTFKAALARGR